MAIGIVCEYNPFHKGHLYHLQTARATYANLYGCTPAAIPIICVMSGHYVQRGEPALLDKWTRTRMALAAGASLVIELPTYYSTATAEWFAYGSISESEDRFFGGIKNFKKNYLKPLSRKEYR